MNANQDVYASLATRIKAGIVDGIILIGLFVSIPLLMHAMTKDGSPFTGVAMYSPLLLLEPFLVAFLGATIGQWLFGLKVMRVATRSNCPLPMAFVRYIAKGLLGSISMIYMLFSKKHQAIHDHMAGTVVVISENKLLKNPDLARYGEVEQTLSSSYDYPSGIRRFIFFILWYALLCFALGVVVEVVALTTVDGYAGDRFPEPIEAGMRILFAVLFITLAVFAAKGYLPGARRKKKFT